METNYLEQFKSNVQYASDKYLLSFKPEQIDFCIQILKNFFSEEYFILKQSTSETNITGLKANKNWIIYNLAQTAEYPGTILNVLEISCLLYYFSQNEKDQDLLKKKFKKNNNEINNDQIRSNLFELYVSAILEKGKFKVSIDDNTYPNKPLDILVDNNGKQYVVECKTLSEALIEDEISEMIGFISASYKQILETNNSNYKYMRALPTSSFWRIKDKAKITEAKNCFKDLFLAYYTDLKEALENDGHINVPYTQNKEIEDYSINIEPFKEDLFEAYDGLLQPYPVWLKYKFFMQQKGDFCYPGINIDSAYIPKPIEERIKKSIEEKKEQHKNHNSDGLIIFLEYENYVGIRPTINLDSINANRIKGILHDNQVVCVVHKDTNNKENINRRMVVIAKDETTPVYNTLKNLNLNPFIVLK